MNRYQRQILLPMLGGEAGQRRLLASRVLLIGCGALGATIADLLARAGIGHLRIVDRDVVELSNLQRQTLFDEQDARQSIPKAIAAAQRLARVNSEIKIDPVVADVHAGNIERLAGLERPSSAGAGAGARVDLILDGTDNAQTRYLINDVSVKHELPWIYGACVGTEGRAMTIRPPTTACLRCVFPEPPGAGELPTCDTAGVLGPAATTVASFQAAEAIKLLSASAADTSSATQLLSVDLWTGRFRSTSIEAKRPDCLACGQQRCFEFLSDRSAETTTALCGRQAVQVRPPTRAEPIAPIDLHDLATRLESAGEVARTPHLLKFRPRDEVGAVGGITLTVFPDARAVIHGTSDPAQARSIYARYIGA